MADFKNTLSWSRTRISTLHHCKRQYYYQYYLKWDGWSWDAPERRKVAYRLSKMSNLPLLVGSAVHDTIKVMLEQLREHGCVTEENPSLYARREILTRVWRDALADLWKRNPKRHPPMYEIYYGQQVPPERLKEMGAKVARCLDSFQASALFGELSTEDPSRWRAVDPDFDQALQVTVEGFPVWAIPDFARETADGVCEIWDWKTGRENPADKMLPSDRKIAQWKLASQGWMMMTMPTNPTRMAIQRRQPTCSPRKGTDSAVISNGMPNIIEDVTVSGR